MDPKRRLVIIVSPGSGRGKWPQALRQVQRQLPRGTLAEVILADAIEIALADRLKHLAPSHVVVIGGDGAWRQVLALLYRHLPNVSANLVPCGTANMFARTWAKFGAKNTPQSPGKGLWADHRGHVMGTFDHTLFTLAASCGHLARVGLVSAESKRRWGKIAYLLELWQLLKQHEVLQVSLTVAGQTHLLPAQALFIVTPDYARYGLGLPSSTLGATAAGQPSPQLGVIVVPPQVGAWHCIQLLWGVYRLRLPAYFRRRGYIQVWYGPQVTVRLQSPQQWVLDGDAGPIVADVAVALATTTRTAAVPDTKTPGG